MRISVSSFYALLMVTLLTGACDIGFTAPAGISFPPTPTPAAKVPADWKKIETSHFIVSIPPDMKEKKVRGIDTSLWQYNSKTISLAIEAGFLGGDFGFVQGRYESTWELRSLNGREVQYLTLDLNKPNLKYWSFNADGSTKVTNEEKNLVVGMYFPKEHISFVTTRVPAVSHDVVDNILNSITLK